MWHTRRTSSRKSKVTYGGIIYTLKLLLTVGSCSFHSLAPLKRKSLELEFIKKEVHAEADILHAEADILRAEADDMHAEADAFGPDRAR